MNGAVFTQRWRQPLRQVLWGLGLWACVFGLALEGVGCAKAQVDLAGAQSPGDESTMALVAIAVDFHKKADLALAEGRREDARMEMEELLGVCERYQVRTVEGWDVKFDAATRLARLHLEDNNLPAAEVAAQRGLAGADEAPPTLFHGYLLQTLADVKEKQDDPRGSVENHTRAIQVFKGVLDAQRGGLPPRQSDGGTP